MNVRVGVAVLIIRKGGVVLVGKRKGSHGEGTWTVPGGHLEMGESVQDCARREVLEETGLELTKVSHAFETTEDIFSEDKHYITLWVEAEIAEDAVAQNMEPHKCEGWEWHDVRQIPQPHFLGLANLIKKRRTYISYLS